MQEDPEFSKRVQDAINRDFLQLLRKIFHEDVKKNMTDFDIFQYACTLGIVRLAKYMYSKGVDIHANDESGLSMACLRGHLQIVQFLVEECSVPYYIEKWATDSYDENGCKGILRKKSYGFVSRIVRNPVNINVFGGRPLYNACIGGNLDVVKYLHARGARIDVRVHHKHSPLLIGCSFGHVGIVAYFLDKGANVDLYFGMSKTEWPLWVATNAGHLQVVRCLVMKGAHINLNNGAILKLAVEKGFREIVEYLVDQGANVNADNGEPLHIAIRSLHSEIAILLIKKGANVHQYNPHIWHISFVLKGTPIERAARLGLVDVVKCLVEHGAKIEINNNRTIINAADSENVELVRYLVDNGADPTCINLEKLHPKIRARMRAMIPELGNETKILETLKDQIRQRISYEDVCPSCLGALKTELSMDVVFGPTCGHTFCKSCFLKGCHCPVCKAPF